jgi:hypothetical protein
MPHVRTAFIWIFLAVWQVAGAQQTFQQFYPSAYELIYSIFSLGADPDPNEGLTVFLSTLVPMGGSAESMGMAYTAVARDASFMELNPAASAIQKSTQFALFHNNWIADSRIEAAVYTLRFGGFGFGVGGKWLYLPFTERDDFGARVTTGYYSEVIGIGNMSVHLFPGYYFYGLAVGASAKLAFRSFPDYADETGVVRPGSGASQSALATLIDAGALTKFNLLKFYQSREKNFSVGVAVKNIGPPIRGEAMPTLATVGLAYSPLKPILISADISQPINLMNLSKSERFFWGIGYAMSITSFWELRAGFMFKGNNPRLSAGASIELFPLTLDINYTLDLTTQFSPLNRMSISARFDMGDMGRAERARQADELYILGLDAYASGDLETAVRLWTRSLELNPGFDPARESRATALSALELQKRMLELQRLE